MTAWLGKKLENHYLGHSSVAECCHRTRTDGFYAGLQEFDRHIDWFCAAQKDHLKFSMNVGYLEIIHFERWDFPWNKPSILG